MTGSNTTASPVRESILAEFEDAWRDGSPVFACCRRTAAISLNAADGVIGADVTTRVNALRAAVEAELPGHLDGHRCCVGHLADIAFDLPDTAGAAV